VRIIVIGGAGTIGKAVVAALTERHEVVVAGRRSDTVPVDIRSPNSVRDMFRQVGAFDAHVCAAGEAHFGPFDTMSEDELALGIESKLLGQIRLVLLGRSLIADGGSFTLMSGYLFDDPLVRGWPPTATSSSDASTPVDSPSLWARSRRLS
jgi:NAD(P)-dependent dehydrogenase (short-subunit alcohol dehydrogenase family)